MRLSPATNVGVGVKGLSLVFVTALLLRLVYFAQALDYPLLFVPQLDEQYYLDWARQLAGLDARQDVAGGFMDPLYAWLLAVSLSVFGDTTLPVRIVQVLADCGTAALTAGIGARLWGLRGGLIAGLLYAAYPLAWLYAPTLLKTTLTTSVVTLSVWLLVEALYRPHWARWLLLGALAGAAVFLRANLLLLFPLIMLVMLWCWRRLEQPVRGLIALAAGAAIPLLMGGFVNQATLGEFTILPSTGGTTLYSSNNPDNPNGSYLPPSFVEANNPAKLADAFRVEAEHHTGRSMTPDDVSAYWRDKALGYLLSAPDVIPRLLLAKLADLIGHTEIPNNHSVELGAMYIPMLRIAWPEFALALGLGVPGLVLGLRRETRAVVLLVPIGVVVITSLLYYSTARFRLPMVPMLLLGAGFLVDDVLRRGRQAWPALAAAVAIGAVSLAIPGSDGNVDHLRLNLALAHVRIGEPERAREVLRVIDSGTRSSVRYWEALGEVALSQEDYAAALDAYRRALPSKGDDAELLHNAALAALRAGEPDLALQFFSRARQISGNAEYLYWLGETLETLHRPDDARRAFEGAVAEGEEGADYVVKARAALARLHGMLKP